MSANQEHVHLAWPIWLDLKVIPTHDDYLSRKQFGKIPRKPIPAALVAAAPDQPIPPVDLATYNEWVKNQKGIDLMMFLTMDLEIQRNLAHLGANNMLKELKALYSKQAKQELLQTVRDFHTCKQEEGQSVSSYVLKMKSYIDQLERLGHLVTLNLGVSLILVRLSKEYDSFMQNYNMHGMGKTVNELHAMLKLHEETLPKKVVAPALHAIRAGKVQKNKNKKPSKAAKGVQGKGKGKKAYAYAEPSYAPKQRILHHLKRIILQRMRSSITAVNTSWVYDTGCGTHICNTTQGLWGSKKLNSGALSLYMGNGQRAAVKAIGNYHLCLPSGLVIVLNNCHYAASITRGIILVSRLYEDGFINRFELNNAISHCRLGHISKKHIEKLQHDGLLNSTNIESLGKCVSCMSGKIARKPYSHQVERAKDLLRLIHIDVCGLFRIVSRQGANYFVTFTDDFSRYGYVYLLKHKHEVFKTFKVFQKEVENQLRKTIKSLRSNRGGEYISQEFLDHLKEHGIISHRTPPYTPQHNGVSEKRNRTLLDMVRSMMSQTTLPFGIMPLSLLHAFLTWFQLRRLIRHHMKYGMDKPLSCLTYEYRAVKHLLSVIHLPNLTNWNPDLLKASGSLENLEIIQEEDTNPSLDTSLNHEEDDQEIDEPQIDVEENELGDHDERANYKAALLDPESEKWLASMHVSMQTMKDNDVWELIELPPNAKIVGHKWLFKKKTDMDGAVHTFKSRLAAKGLHSNLRG
ncbi:retrotransposon protein, putative, ty1-copia subclass [Tanacetum coccineum]